MSIFGELLQFCKRWYIFFYLDIFRTIKNIDILLKNKIDLPERFYQSVFQWMIFSVLYTSYKAADPAKFQETVNVRIAT